MIANRKIEVYQDDCSPTYYLYAWDGDEMICAHSFYGAEGTREWLPDTIQSLIRGNDPSLWDEESQAMRDNAEGYMARGSLVYRWEHGIGDLDPNDVMLMQDQDEWEVLDRIKAAQGGCHMVRLYNHLADMDDLVGYMDDEIREELHGEMAPCSRQEFLDAYIIRHYKKYGEDFKD